MVVVVDCADCTMKLKRGLEGNSTLIKARTFCQGSTLQKHHRNILSPRGEEIEDLSSPLRGNSLIHEKGRNGEKREIIDLHDFTGRQLTKHRTTGRKPRKLRHHCHFGAYPRLHVIKYKYLPSPLKSELVFYQTNNNIEPSNLR